jgi:pimeloyl-ACP methyl ester carboxylesterase
MKLASRACATLLVTLVTVACGSATTHPKPKPKPVIVDNCLKLDQTTQRVTIHPPGNAATISGVLVGRAPTTFVLTNESDEDLCSWLPFARMLEHHGYSALLYDYLDPSALPAEARAAVRAAQTHGARRIVLMGASVGARASIEAAAEHPPGVIAVISLSAERTVRSDPTDLIGPARHVSAPALLISAERDPFTEDATRPLLKALGSRRKQALIVPGLDHGTFLLSHKKVRGAVLGFLAAGG